MGCGVLPGVSEPDSPIHRFIAYLGAADVVILILPLVYAPCLRRRRRQPTQHLSSTRLRACVDAPECQALRSVRQWIALRSVLGHEGKQGTAQQSSTLHRIPPPCRTDEKSGWE